jgi:hypothetical protein
MRWTGSLAERCWVVVSLRLHHLATLGSTYFSFENEMI